MIHLAALLVLVGIVTPARSASKGRTSSAHPGKKPSARTDRYGDPLPPGALARQGTVRFRHPEYVESSHFSPDGKTLITSDGSQVYFWDVQSGKERRRLKGQDVWLALSPDGKTAAARKDKLMALIDVRTGKEHCRFPTHQYWRAAAAFTSDGKMVAVGEDGQVALRDVPSGKLRTRLTGVHGGRVWSLSFSRDGKYLASACSSGSACVWTVATRKPWRKLTAHNVALSPDGKLLACFWALGLHTSCEIRDLATDKALPMPKDVPWLACPSFSADSKSVMGSASGPEGAISVSWNATTGKKRWVIDGYIEALSPDGKTAAMRDGEFAFHLCDALTGKELRPRAGHRDQVTAIAFSPDGRTLATLGDGQTALLWRWQKGEQLRRFKKPHNSKSRLAFSAGTSFLAALGDGPSTCIDLWQISSGKRKGHWSQKDDGSRVVVFTAGEKLPLLEEGRHQPNDIVAFHLSANGKSLTLVCADGALQVWGVASGKKQRTLALQGLRKEWRSLEEAPTLFSPDGMRVVAAQALGEWFSVWETRTGKLLRQFKPKKEARGQWVSGLAVSHDTRILATATSEVRVWDLKLGKQLCKLAMPKLRNPPVALSPNGRWLACCGKKHAVCLFEVASGKEVGRWQGHLQAIQALAFSPDGKVLASGGRDGTVLLWDLTKKPPHSRTNGL